MTRSVKTIKCDLSPVMLTEAGLGTVGFLIEFISGSLGRFKKVQPSFELLFTFQGGE